MANYLNKLQLHLLMDKLKERFDSKSTVSDANEIFQLFHLRCPIFEMNKLLDNATNIVSQLLSKEIDVLNHIFYSAIVSIIPLVYGHTRVSYGAGIHATTPAGHKPVYKLHAPITELHQEFNSY